MKKPSSRVQSSAYSGQRAGGRGERFLWVSLLIILMVMPLHSFLYTATSVHLPHLVASILRIWKELLVCLMGVVAVGVMWRRPGVASRVMHNVTTWLIIGFGLLHLIVMLAFHTPLAPALLAVKINLIFLILFILAQIAVESINVAHRERRILQAIIIPATLVGAFGVAQMFLLPKDFLTHFGYGPTTILPYTLIQESHIVRIISTLWGPNQLASYLIIPIAVTTWLVAKKKWLALVPMVLLLTTLYGSYSRAGWLAAAVTIFAVIWLVISQWGIRLALLGVVIILAVAGWLALPGASHSKLSYDLLHSSPQGVGGSSSSDLGHQEAITQGFDKVRAHTLGSGLEAAGRASEYDNTNLFTEDFYLQIAVQTGIEGLLLFLAILVAVGWRLARACRTHPLALPFLASFIGLGVMNVLHHTWSDGATALIWWGAAGAILGLEQINSKAEYVEAN